MDDEVRFFITCAGRTGSSLLAAILAGAGAEFGIPAPDHWNINAGALESRASQDAAAHYSAAHSISADRPVGSPIDRMRWTWHRHQGKRALSKALAATYIKCPGADLIVHPAFRLGYFPRVIVSYRKFEEQCRSFFQMQSYSSADWIAARYVRCYSNALALLSLYGGCLVSYNDLADPSCVSWASALSEVTGIPACRLLELRDVRNTGQPDSSELPVIDRRAHDLFEEMEKVRGRAFEPSQQALRNWNSRNAARLKSVMR